MSTRILSVLALPLALAACVETPANPPAAEEEAAPVEAAAPAPAPTPAAQPAPAPAVAVGEPAPVPVALPAPSDPVDDLSPPPAAESAEAEAPEAAPAPAATPAGRLGTTVASLGPPTQGGLWLETALVEAPTQGRIEYNGQTVSVELRPSGGEPGSGSQISLDAMRALGAPLTGLPELTVFAG